jgi:hypothetical protein
MAAMAHKQLLWVYTSIFHFVYFRLKHAMAGINVHGFCKWSLKSDQDLSSVKGVLLDLKYISEGV